MRRLNLLLLLAALVAISAGLWGIGERGNGPQALPGEGSTAFPSSASAEGVAAPAAIELLEPDFDAVLERAPIAVGRLVAGRVVHLDGSPARARVECGVVTAGTTAPRRKTTDAKGLFRFEGLPDDELSLSVAGLFFVPTQVPIPTGSTEDLLVRVTRRGWLELAVPPERERPDSFALLDDLGNPLAFIENPVTRTEKTHSRFGWTTNPYENGWMISHGILAPETTVEIEVQHKGARPYRLPVVMDVERTTRVRAD